MIEHKEFSVSLFSFYSTPFVWEFSLFTVETTNHLRSLFSIELDRDLWEVYELDLFWFHFIRQ